jgi:CBS domain-containing protein
MLVKDVCTMDVVCCDRHMRVSEAARLMRHHHVGDIVVIDDPTEGRTPIGLVTDRDLVLDVLGTGLDPGTTEMASLVHRTLVVAHESEDTAQALARMREHGVRRIPVVNNQGAVVGIVTLDDLLRLLVTDANALLEVITKGQHQEHRTRR